jgi:4-hydroxybenzoate polyprenyltransferase
MALLRLIRFPNLCIVALTQWLLYDRVVVPALVSQQITPLLSKLDCLCYIGVTITLTAAGYIINDIMDLPADRINKPDRILIDRHISRQTASWFYLTLGLTGFMMTTYLGLACNRLHLIGLYPIAFILLYVYSAALKHRPILGNLLIALFCAGVAGAIWLAEGDALAQLTQRAPGRSRPVRFLLVWYMVFAFLSTLYRELVKDLEDQVGDRKVGSRTAPIVWGSTSAKILAGISGGLLLVFLVWQSQFIYAFFPNWLVSFVAVGLVLPLIWTFFDLAFAKKKTQFHRISTVLKVVMLNGVLLLLFANL